MGEKKNHNKNQLETFFCLGVFFFSPGGFFFPFSPQFVLFCLFPHVVFLRSFPSLLLFFSFFLLFLHLLFSHPPIPAPSSLLPPTPFLCFFFSRPGVSPLLCLSYHHLPDPLLASIRSAANVTEPRKDTPRSHVHTLHRRGAARRPFPAPPPGAGRGRGRAGRGRAGVPGPPREAVPRRGYKRRWRRRAALNRSAALGAQAAGGKGGRSGASPRLRWQGLRGGGCAPPVFVVPHPREAGAARPPQPQLSRSQPLSAASHRSRDHVWGRGGESRGGRLAGWHTSPRRAWCCAGGSETSESPASGCCGIPAPSQRQLLRTSGCFFPLRSSVIQSGTGHLFLQLLLLFFRLRTAE